MLIISQALGLYMPRSIPIIFCIIAFIIIGYSRLLIRTLYKRINLDNLKKVVILGTNTYAKILDKKFQESEIYNSLFFFSNDVPKENEINGKKVFNFYDNSHLIKKFEIDIIFVTENLIQLNPIKQIILQILMNKPLEIKILKKLDVLYENFDIYKNFRDLKIIELLVDKLKTKQSLKKTNDYKNTFGPGEG